MALIQTVAPSSEPVSVAEVKAHLRITTVDDNELLESYIKASRHQAENYMKRQVLPATWQLKFDDFSNSTQAVTLPRPPLSSTASDVTITYINSTVSGSSSTTLSSTAYTVDNDSEPGRVYPSHGNEWPTDVLDVNFAVTIQYITGYVSESVPENIKLWIKQSVGAMYEFREPVFTNNRLEMLQEVPRAYFNGLLDPYVVLDFES